MNGKKKKGIERKMIKYDTAIETCKESFMQDHL